MRITRCVLICLVPSLLSAQTIAVRRLEPGAPVERTLKAGSVDKYALDLRANDVVSVKLTDKGQDVTLSVFGPTGDLKRAFSSEVLEGEPARFFVGQSGSWRLAVQAHAKSASADYTIALLGATAAHPVAATAETSEGDRIKHLKTP